MSVMRAALLTGGVLLGLSAIGGSAERIFPFPMEGEGLWSLWTTTRPPAGNDGFIRAQGNDFVDSRGNVRRFLGINLYGPAQLCDKSTADATARQLRYWGFSAIRLFPQYAWQMREDRDFSKGIDPKLLDRFDYFFAKLKENGIHATMNLHSARTAGYRFKGFKTTIKENKGLDNFDPVFIEHQKEFCRTIFDHVNPYTKIAYRDEPAILSWEINNECSIVESWYRGRLWEKMLPPFRTEFTRQFNDWLKARDGEMAKPCEIGEANEADVGEFLIATETRYWHEMIRYLREDLKSKQLVNGGTLEYGATYPHVAGDFLDSHVYYGGLNIFPKKKWNMKDWLTGNRALVVEPDRGMIRRGMARVFENRVFGRPYTISECSQMHQQTTAADFFPIFMALGAFQNVSAIYAYTWTHVADHSYQSKRWLDMRGNAKYLAHWPAARNIFERGDVASGFTRPERAVHDWTCAAEREQIVRTKFALKLQDRPTDPFAFLKAPTGTRYTDLDVAPIGAEGATALPPLADADRTNALRRATSSTGELCWDGMTAGCERLTVDTPRTKFVSMFGPKGTSHAFGDGTTVTLGDTLLNWAAISLTETKPQHWLLAATGWQQPTGAVVQVYGGKVLRPHEEAKMLRKRITTCSSMGDVPFMCEGVRATVRFPVAKEFCAYVTPLDGDARPFGRTRILEPADGFIEFSISEADRTIWYRIELRRFNLPAFGVPIPASAYDPTKPDVGMSAAKVFDAPIAGLTKIGKLRIPSAREMPETSSASIGFEGLDRKLFNPTDDLYAKLGASGVKRARVQTMWSRCETEKGRFDFSALDEVVDKLLAQGIRPWFSVGFGNTLYMKGCYTMAAVGCVPLYYGEECRAAWIRYVGELAKRYRGKVHEWEVWNEGNVDHFWQPHPANARDYLELVKITASAIRAEIPDARIGGCSSSMGIMAWEREFFEAGGAKEIDFWCSHAYEQIPENYRGQQRVASKGARVDYVSGIADMRAFIDAHGGKHVALWQGESGFPSWFPDNHWLFPRGVCKAGWRSQANQAKWLLRRWLTDRRAGQAVSSFYQASDIVRHYSMGHTTQTHPAEHGILNGWTNEPKMSYYALGHYNALFATARFDASVDVALTPADDQGVKTCAFAFRDAAARPLFIYYAPFNFSQNYQGTCYAARTDAALSVPEALAPHEPVLVDMLRGGVYALGAGRRENGRIVFTGLPLTDYPLVLADRARVRIADNRCAVVAYRGNEIRLYASPLAYEVVHDRRTVVAKTPIGLTLDGVSVANAGCRSVVEKKLSGTVATPVYKKSSVDLSGVETLADFGGFAVRLVARADGVAYRFELKKAARIDDETAGVTIPAAARCVFNRTKDFGLEETAPEFSDARDLADLKMEPKKRYFYLPFMYRLENVAVLITESDIHTYPALYFSGAENVWGGVRLSSVFAGWPKATERASSRKITGLKEGGRWIRVTEHEPYLVQAMDARTLPWRVFVLADKPEKLCENDIVYALAKPADPKADFSWVKPGKVAWEWWNAFNNQAARRDPARGCTTETYKAFVDFAAKTGVEYVIMDEGWSEHLNIWKFNSAVDVPHVIDHAGKRGVGIILWIAWAQAYGKEELVAAHFSKLGAKGFKVDFMDRADAEVANFLENFAKACAKYKMLVDYHGATHPVGLHREYPNILNYEAVHGLEMMKFCKADKDMTVSDVACVYTRMCAGPMDYTPGAMMNYKIGAYKGDYRVPGSVGTRVHQMAQMALYEAPLQMLCDSVINYEKNMECFSFMSKVPTVWNATVGLPGTPETVAAVVRQAKDGSWYAAAITNKDPHDYTLDTAFLGKGAWDWFFGADEWTAEIFRDAATSDDEPMTYVHETKTVKVGDKLNFRLASGGGFIVRFTK